jgi:hypothetical protein
MIAFTSNYATILSKLWRLKGKKPATAKLTQAFYFNSLLDSAKYSDE